MGTASCQSHRFDALDRVVGSYVFSGTDLSGETGSGLLTVVRSGRVFHVTWESDTTITGVGLLLGDVLSVAFGGPSCSLAAYVVQPDGTLDGLWSPGGSSVGTEFATPDQTGDTVENVTTYTANGTNDDRSPYTAELSMRVAGEILAVRWDFEGVDENYVGIGLKSDDVIAVGWDFDFPRDTTRPGGCGVATYSVIGADTLLGVWSSPAMGGTRASQSAVRQLNTVEATGTPSSSSAAKEGRPGRIRRFGKPRSGNAP